MFYSYNFLKLNIYYQDLNFENVTEEAEIEVSHINKPFLKTIIPIP